MDSMKVKLREHFLKIGPRRFVVATVLLLAITDLVNSYYLKLYWLKKDYSQQMVRLSIQQSDIDPATFSPETFAEATAFVNNAFYFFVFLILANNFFFYLFYLRKKLWAQGYVLFYTLTAAIFSLSFVLDNAGLGMGWLAYNVLTIPFYCYLYFGVKLLKPETTITPANRRKGQ